MQIIDSQVHIWAPSTPGRPWPPITKQPHRSAPLGADELLRQMDAAGVARAILISPSWEGVRNDVVLAAARASPDRFGVMGRIDFEAADGAEELARLSAEPGILGFRVTFHTPQLQQSLAAGRYDWLWEAAERHATPLMVYAPHSVLDLIEPVAERHPRLRLAMCHFSIPILTKGEPAFAGLDRLLRLARFPNVAAKASSLPGHSSMPYPYVDLHKPLQRVLEAFGDQRVFWGTDLSKLPCTYEQAIAMYTEHMPWLSAAQQRWVMGQGVREWFGWD